MKCPDVWGQKPCLGTQARYFACIPHELQIDFQSNEPNGDSPTYSRCFQKGRFSPLDWLAPRHHVSFMPTASGTPAHCIHLRNHHHICLRSHRTCLLALPSRPPSSHPTYLKPPAFSFYNWKVVTILSHLTTDHETYVKIWTSRVHRLTILQAELPHSGMANHTGRRRPTQTET